MSLAFGFPGKASEQGIAAAQAAFDGGPFVEAADLARSLHSAAGLALAARAALAQGDFIARSPPVRRALFEQAEKDARAAIALDPDHAESHLYLALALGFLGRMDGTLTAHFAGYAEEARANIDRALALAPDSPWAHALMGGWHLEIAHDGGVLGESIYGASVEKGIAAYRRALALDPGNAAIAYQYALQQIALDGAARRQEAQHVLAAALVHEPGDKFAALAHRRALSLELALGERNEAALRSILNDQLGQGESPQPRNADTLHPLGARPTGSPR
jgi:tetratricopeptide (TPR) repeat protein